jgi:hypothetical protein
MRRFFLIRQWPATAVVVATLAALAGSNLIGVAPARGGVGGTGNFRSKTIVTGPGLVGIRWGETVRTGFFLFRPPVRPLPPSLTVPVEVTVWRADGLQLARVEFN